jgi:hypothetical protein
MMPSPPSAAGPPAPTESFIYAPSVASQTSSTPDLYPSVDQYRPGQQAIQGQIDDASSAIANQVPMMAFQQWQNEQKLQQGLAGQYAQDRQLATDGARAKIALDQARTQKELATPPDRPDNSEFLARQQEERERHARVTEALATERDPQKQAALGAEERIRHNLAIEALRAAALANRQNRPARPTAMDRLGALIGLPGSAPPSSAPPAAPAAQSSPSVLPHPTTGLPVSVGGRGQMTDDIADQFVRAANGDADKARALAKQYGWGP